MRRIVSIIDGITLMIQVFVRLKSQKYAQNLLTYSFTIRLISSFLFHHFKVFASDQESSPNSSQSSSVIVSGGMIKRQSISGPHYWPHLNDPMLPSRSSTAAVFAIKFFFNACKENPHYEALRAALSTASAVAPEGHMLPLSPTNSITPFSNQYPVLSSDAENANFTPTTNFSPHSPSTITPLNINPPDDIPLKTNH